jgi:hypothetical protein
MAHPLPCVPRDSRELAGVARLRSTAGLHRGHVQADLNGDGSKELLYVTEDLELHMLAPQLASRFEQGFAPAVVKGKKTIEVPSVLVGGRTPLAMKAGYIDPPEQDFVHVPRKMVIVIVTRGWVVVCLDHNLNVLWQTSIHERFPRHATTREVRLHVAGPWHRIRECVHATCEHWVHDSCSADLHPHQPPRGQGERQRHGGDWRNRELRCTGRG